MAKDTKTTDVVVQLLTALEVKRVVFVDDCFATTKEAVQGLCDDLSTEDINAAAAFDDHLFESGEEDVIREGIRETINRMKKEDIKAAFIKLADKTDGGTGIQDRQHAEAFIELIGNEFIVKTLSLEDWKAQKDEILEQASDSRTLFIFDEDFKDEGEAEDEGHRQLAAIVKDPNESNILYALLTHVANAEDELPPKIEGDYPNLSELIVIAKSRLSDDQIGFALRLRLAFLANQFQGLIQKLRGVINGAYEEAIKEVDKLKVGAFERIIFHSSNEEGAWPPETVVRIMGVFQNQNANLNLRTDESVHRLVNECLKVCEVEVDQTDDAIHKKAYLLQRKEVVLPSEFVNPAHLPVSLGDVFKSETGDRFVLLGQPCGLAVRGTGLRNSKSSDRRQVAVLVKLEEREKNGERVKGLLEAEDANSVESILKAVVEISGPDDGEKNREMMKELLKGKDSKNTQKILKAVAEISGPQNAIVPFMANEATHVVEASFKQAFQMPLWILDLCVFQDDGKCRINSNDGTATNLIAAWGLRHNFLRGLAESISKALAAIQEAGNPVEGIESALLRLSEGGPIKPDVSLNEIEKSWMVGAKLARCCRIQDPYATALLNGYGRYITREAFPHDLTRFS